jgi:GTP cyclohydrolase I
MKLGTLVYPKPRAESAMRSFFSELRIPKGEWADPSLDIENTPRRIAKMLKDEMLSSYHPGAYADLCRRFTCFPSDGNDAMVLMAGIDFTSMCSHHMLPFSGVAHVAYIPGNVVVGASKIPRVVTHYSHMLQIQERMSRQIADFIYRKAQARVVVVLLSASHNCIRCRGIKQQNVQMVTTAIRPAPGGPNDPLLRGILDEFYSQIQLLGYR